MRQSWSQRIAGSLFPAVLWVIGLAGIPDDLEQWARWLREGHLLLLLGALLVTVAVAAWLGAARCRGGAARDG